jgi:hypothetical protein
VVTASVSRSRATRPMTAGRKTAGLYCAYSTERPAAHSAAAGTRRCDATAGGGCRAAREFVGGHRRPCGCAPCCAGDFPKRFARPTVRICADTTYTGRGSLADLKGFLSLLCCSMATDMTANPYLSGRANRPVKEICKETWGRAARRARWRWREAARRQPAHFGLRFRHGCDGE